MQDLALTSSDIDILELRIWLEGFLGLFVSKGQVGK